MSFRNQWVERDRTENKKPEKEEAECLKTWTEGLGGAEHRICGFKRVGMAFCIAVSSLVAIRIHVKNSEKIKQNNHISLNRLFIKNYLINYNTIKKSLVNL